MHVLHNAARPLASFLGFSTIANGTAILWGYVSILRSDSELLALNRGYPHSAHVFPRSPHNTYYKALAAGSRLHDVPVTFCHWLAGASASERLAACIGRGGSSQCRPPRLVVAVCRCGYGGGQSRSWFFPPRFPFAPDL